MVAVVVVLAVRGTSNWSGDFEAFLLALFGVAVVLAMLGFAEATLRPNVAAHNRMLAVALSIGTLAIGALLAAWALAISGALVD